MGLTGTVSTLPDKNNKVNVRCGILQSKVDLSDLQLIAEDAYGNPVNSTKQGGSAIKRAFRDADKASSSGKDMDLSRGSSVSTELNLLGMTTDDAVYAVDKYLDDARVAHLAWHTSRACASSTARERGPSAMPSTPTCENRSGSNPSAWAISERETPE